MPPPDKSLIKRGWHWDKANQELQAYNNGVEIIQYPLGNVYYVDGTNGVDTNSGTSWTTSFSTIQKALDTVGTDGGRGRGKIYVAPGGYTEDLTTPLNAAAPFCELVAVNPTPGRSYGAVYLTASTAGAAVLTVQARGWRISGFEFDALADAECVILGGTTAGNNAAGTLIEDCLFVGQNQGLTGIDWQNGVASNALCTVRNSGFYGFTSGSTAGSTMRCTISGIDQPTFALIEDCWFGDSDNYIDMNPRGFKESTIRNNTFYFQGANQNADEKFDNTGGSNCQVYGNAFGGVYTLAGGYVAGSGDDWSGNMAEAVSGESANGWTFAVPAS
ncbi:hypothetical protein LCGC14_1078470 [marine sediment metagenome]|uniref:Right handed beta helix domain-containing protein n=1 Tax=marine sediment metagenome TaxID=412755 RepID=A0A0F9MG41_9ZZZZ